MRQAIQDWHESKIKAITGFIKREWPVVAFGIQFAILAALFLWVSSIASSSHDSLCTFQGSLEQRVADTEAFLENNPEGIPGIPAETLMQSVDNQKKTIAALSEGGLDCD